MAIPNDVYLIEVNKMGPAGSGVTSGDWNALVASIHANPYALYDIGPEQSNSNTTSPAIFLANTSLPYGQLPAGTWAASVTVDGLMRKSSPGEAEVILMMNGVDQAAETIAGLITTNRHFSATWNVSGIAGGTTPTFGLRYRAVTGTQYMSAVKIYGVFTRTA